MCTARICLCEVNTAGSFFAYYVPAFPPPARQIIGVNEGGGGGGCTEKKCQKAVACLFFFSGEERETRRDANARSAARDSGRMRCLSLRRDTSTHTPVMVTVTVLDCPDTAGCAIVFSSLVVSFLYRPLVEQKPPSGKFLSGLHAFTLPLSALVGGQRGWSPRFFLLYTPASTACLESLCVTRYAVTAASALRFVPSSSCSTRLSCVSSTRRVSLPFCHLFFLITPENRDYRARKLSRRFSDPNADSVGHTHEYRVKLC